MPPLRRGRLHQRLYRCGDLSAGSGHNAVSRDPAFGHRFLEEFQDRLFFGTDICAPTNQTPLVEFLRDAVEGGHISREAYEKIGWKNAERLLGITGTPCPLSGAASTAAGDAP